MPASLTRLIHRASSINGAKNARGVSRAPSTMPCLIAVKQSWISSLFIFLVLHDQGHSESYAEYLTLAKQECPAISQVPLQWYSHKSMTQALERYLQICVETRLQTAIISLWPHKDSAAQFWRDAAVPMLKGIGLTPLLASLLPIAGRGQTPTKALLSSMVSSTDPSAASEIEGLWLADAIEYLLTKRWDLGENLVLANAGMDRWAGPHRRNDVSALRAVAQANPQWLFIVYVCTDPMARRRLFSDKDEALYREGMTISVNSDGTM